MSRSDPYLLPTLILNHIMLWESLRLFIEADIKDNKLHSKNLTKRLALLFSRISTPNINSFYKYNSREDLYRHALAWRSLVHKFILPLVGIFGDKSEQFLVSPFMTNGTLTEWRKNHPSLVVSDIHRMVRLQRSSE